MSLGLIANHGPKPREVMGDSAPQQPRMARPKARFFLGCSFQLLPFGPMHLSNARWYSRASPLGVHAPASRSICALHRAALSCSSVIWAILSLRYRRRLIASWRPGGRGQIQWSEIGATSPGHRPVMSRPRSLKVPLPGARTPEDPAGPHPFC